MVVNLFLSLGSAGFALVLWHRVRYVPAVFGLLACWQLFCAMTARRRPRPRPILCLGGYTWDVFSFCRGWLITGQVGTGKTVAAINTMLWQVSRNCPNWGGICVDDKGVYWETLSGMLGHLGRRSDLVLLQVRPDGAGAEWQPTHRFNFLDLPHLSPHLHPAPRHGRAGACVAPVRYPTAPTNTIEVHDFAALAKGDIALWSVAAALRDLATTHAGHPELYLNSLGTLIAAHVFNAPDRNSQRPTGVNTLSPIQLKLVVDYVEAHLNENFPVSKLAALVGLSTCHFIRKFKDTTGLSPHKFVIRARVERAHDYLRTGNFRVADAALEVGFCDQSHLDRYFRRYYGFAPSELLKQRHSQF